MMYRSRRYGVWRVYRYYMKLARSWLRLLRLIRRNRGRFPYPYMEIIVEGG